MSPTDDERQELEKQKLRKEIEKLEVEASQLNRTIWQRTEILAPVATVLAAALGLSGYILTSSVAKERADLDAGKKQLDKERNDFKAKQDQLSAELREEQDAVSRYRGTENSALDDLDRVRQDLSNVRNSLDEVQGQVTDLAAQKSSLERRVRTGAVAGVLAKMEEDWKARGRRQYKWDLPQDGDHTLLMSLMEEATNDIRRIQIDYLSEEAEKSQDHHIKSLVYYSLYTVTLDESWKRHLLAVAADQWTEDPYFYRRILLAGRITTNDRALFLAAIWGVGHKELRGNIERMKAEDLAYLAELDGDANLQIPGPFIACLRELQRRWTDLPDHHEIAALGKLVREVSLPCFIATRAAKVENREFFEASSPGVIPYPRPEWRQDHRLPPLGVYLADGGGTVFARALLDSSERLVQWWVPLQLKETDAVRLVKAVINQDWIKEEDLPPG